MYIAPTEKSPARVQINHFGHTIEVRFMAIVEKEGNNTPKGRQDPNKFEPLLRCQFVDPVIFRGVEYCAEWFITSRPIRGRSGFETIEPRNYRLGYDAQSLCYGMRITRPDGKENTTAGWEHLLNLIHGFSDRLREDVTTATTPEEVLDLRHLIRVGIRSDLAEQAKEAERAAARLRDMLAAAEGIAAGCDNALNAPGFDVGQLSTILGQLGYGAGAFDPRGHRQYCENVARVNERIGGTFRVYAEVGGQ